MKVVRGFVDGEASPRHAQFRSVFAQGGGGGTFSHALPKAGRDAVPFFYDPLLSVTVMRKRKKKQTSLYTSPRIEHCLCCVCAETNKKKEKKKEI
jgi:hypothetical protein